MHFPKKLKNLEKFTKGARYFLVACLALYGLLMQKPVLAETNDIKPSSWYSDFERPVEKPITKNEVQKWEQQALEGDNRLKRQFAWAYFRQCVDVRFTERCEAMKARRDLGEKFLKEIIDQVPAADDKAERASIGLFQSEYAKRQFDKAIPTYDPESEACQQGLKYAVLAIENGVNCIALLLRTYSYFGYCMKKKDQKYAFYIEQIKNCPIN